jgi:hypothetical protein
VIPLDMPRLRLSTSTLQGEEIVPWLASAGELAYSPHSPPDRDYYFQYAWVIPRIFQGAQEYAGTFGSVVRSERSRSQTALCILESGQTGRPGYPVSVEWKVRAGGCNGPARSLPPF